MSEEGWKLLGNPAIAERSDEGEKKYLENQYDCWEICIVILVFKRGKSEFCEIEPSIMLILNQILE